MTNEERAEKLEELIIQRELSSQSWNARFLDPRLLPSPGMQSNSASTAGEKLPLPAPESKNAGQKFSKPGLLTRKDLKIALREKGFSITEATRIIEAIICSMVRGLWRGERVETPIGRFRRDSKGSTCVTDSLEGSKRVRRLVHRRRAIHYEPDPLDSIEGCVQRARDALAPGDG
jgi:hypothetical protein